MPPFDPAKVPDGPLADLFYDGKTGEGISDEEWDTQRDRARQYDAWPFDDTETARSLGNAD
jgi:hypothetical protein